MVYLHVPFCRSFCTYCDFYSEIACRDRDAQLFESFTASVCAEASRRRDEIEATRDLNTLYIGGGTPSVLPLAYLRQMAAALMTGGVPPAPPMSLRSEASRHRSALQRVAPEGHFRSEARTISFALQGQARCKRPMFSEFTIEVNPEDIVEKGAEYVRGLLDLGVNRVSMGVQSLDDGILRWMNRRHDAAHAREAFRILRDAGVGNISVDLIFGLSQLSEDTLAQTLTELIAWRPEHVSAYQLSVEEGSALGRLAREGRFTEAPQEQCAAQYALICRMLREAGYGHYEISNWALPGREAIHNSAYWSRHPYVGLGPSAHSFDGHIRSWNPTLLPPRSGQLPPETSGCAGPLPSGDGPLPLTMPRVARFPGAVAACAGGSEELSATEAREEEIMLGLRTARGIPEGLLDPARSAAMLADGRLVRLPAGRLRIPEDHWFVSDDIIADLI